MPYRTGLIYRDSVPVEYDGGDYPAMLEKAIERSDYHTWRKQQKEAPPNSTRSIGIGISSYVEGGGIGPDERWMQQMARNVTMEGCGALRDCRYLLHDRDTKYTQSFRAVIASGRLEPLVLPARSPNLNAYAERWVRSVKEECLSKVILFGERSLRRALSEYVEHFHAERNHQGKGNVLLFPRGTNIRRDGSVQCRERLGGLLRYYHQEAA